MQAGTHCSDPEALRAVLGAASSPAERERENWEGLALDPEPRRAPLQLAGPTRPSPATPRKIDPPPALAASRASPTKGPPKGTQGSLKGSCWTAAWGSSSTQTTVSQCTALHYKGDMSTMGSKKLPRPSSVCSQLNKRKSKAQRGPGAHWMLQVPRPLCQK